MIVKTKAVSVLVIRMSGIEPRLGPRLLCALRKVTVSLWTIIISVTESNDTFSLEVLCRGAKHLLQTD